MPYPIPHIMANPKPKTKLSLEDLRMTYHNMYICRLYDIQKSCIMSNHQHRILWSQKPIHCSCYVPKRINIQSRINFVQDSQVCTQNLHIKQHINTREIWVIYITRDIQQSKGLKKNLTQIYTPVYTTCT